MCRTFWHGWKWEILWNMIKGSLLGDYQMENVCTLGSTLKLYHHVPSTYRLYRFYRAFWGILREQLVRVLLPTCSLGDYHERLHPTSYFLPWCSNKNYNPFIPFWGEQTFKFTVTFCVFSRFFSGFASKNSNPLENQARGVFVSTITSWSFF